MPIDYCNTPNWRKRLARGRATLCDVPIDEWTEEIILTAVKQCTLNIFSIPKHVLDENRGLYDIVVNIDPMMLRIVPKHICEIGYDNNDKSFEPNNICLRAIKKLGLAIKFVHKSCVTHDLCMLAIENRPKAIRYIPKEMITLEMALTAVKMAPYVLQYIPEEIREKNPIIEIEAVTSQPHMMQCIYHPLDSYKTKNSVINVQEKIDHYEHLCSIAVQKNGSLSYISERSITSKICEDAVKINPHSILYVPVNLRTIEMWTTLITHKQKSLYFDMKHFVNYFYVTKIPIDTLAELCVQFPEIMPYLDPSTREHVMEHEIYTYIGPKYAAKLD